MSLPDSALEQPPWKAGVVMALWAGGAPVRRRRETGVDRGGAGLGRFSKDTRTSGMFIVGTSGRPGLDPWLGKTLWRRERLPTPVFCPGQFHGLYSPWGGKESDTTERLSLFLVVQ